MLAIGVDGVRFDLLGPEATPSIWAFGRAGFLVPVTIDEATPTWSGPCWATIATGSSRCGTGSRGGPRSRVPSCDCPAGRGEGRPGPGDCPVGPHGAAAGTTDRSAELEKSPAGAGGQGMVRTCGPSAVMATVCSAWAARLPSPLRMVQPSPSMK